MSNSLPPNSSSPQASSRNNDEWIAVLIALLAMGGILFWVLGKDAKAYRQKFTSPAILPTPQSSVSDQFNLSQVLENSLLQHRQQQASPQRVSVPATSSGNVFQSFSPAPTPESPSRSTDVSPAWWMITPFFFTPPDASESQENPGSQTTIVPIPTQESTTTQPQTAASPQSQQQAAQPQTAASPQSQQQAAQPQTAASPQSQQQAAQPQTQASPQSQQQAAQPDIKASPQSKAEIPTPVPFFVLSDVPSEFWAKEFIEYTTENQIIVPYNDGTFQPDKPITRAELAAQLENAFIPQKDQSAQLNYKDVKPDNWAQQAIVDVTQTGFMRGYPGEIFLPNEVVPRVQVLVALVSGLDLKPPRNPEETLKVYQDADQIPKWAVEKIAAATEAGLVVNHPEQNTLNPNQPATRAEVSAMIYQALVESGKAEPISSDYIVKPNN
ncbi:S-layer homology domain-containing protein [Limnoraphis robusta]|uniref:S-layer homology domain-containing protein n=1 Tax=Limnoraphis robusta CCNP1315 TaxID=3110306 RepID=A0ABU5TXC0_9CYAN|nr:S-layer homology domain-containing protein [Limnoraphis robusta]MEA5500286.1 S-layer homology domain-containing protein [Limnoraphis robusta BA-68 BA1]MEA5519357.1 S-layer homology domain-containing protein [Limnoraphis robusta CCNP1315]MEA5545105.1 S-layer homology domain-containing protein [Limnoraphis robusta CCNP1324]